MHVHLHRGLLCFKLLMKARGGVNWLLFCTAEHVGVGEVSKRAASTACMTCTTASYRRGRWVKLFVYHCGRPLLPLMHAYITTSDVSERNNRMVLEQCTSVACGWCRVQPWHAKMAAQPAWRAAASWASNIRHWWIAGRNTWWCAGVVVYRLHFTMSNTVLMLRMSWLWGGSAAVSWTRSILLTVELLVFKLVRMPAIYFGALLSSCADAALTCSFGYMFGPAVCSAAAN